VALEFSQIVAELVQAVSCIGEVEGGQDRLVDFPGCPAADLSAAVQENLEEATLYVLGVSACRARGRERELCRFQSWCLGL
jgi:hypothetical protein